jgi:soluble lytic murein transglycosylase
VLYTIARAQLRMGRDADTRATLLRLVELYPISGAAASAFFLLGDVEHDAGHTLAAAAYFGRATGVRGAGSVAGDAFMRLGGIQLAGRDWVGAVRTYETYRGRYPGSAHREQATYWVARAYARLGAADRARERLEELLRGGSLSYYALRAAELLRQPALPTGRAAAPAPSPGARQRVAAGALRVELLHELGLDDAADAEGRALQARLGTDDAALYDLAEALDALGLTSAGVRIGWALRRRAPDWNPRLLRIVYPFPYRDAIVAESRARGLDPYLVAGLIRQESSFDARARSRVGAVGLMQVMPGTGRTLARGAGTGTFDVGMLERPELNVKLGTTFVADLLRRTNGRVAQMLAAYNAGPARLDRWRRYPEAGDPELFAERIPYDETREYVKIVQANARIYAALYPGVAGEAVSGD